MAQGRDFARVVAAEATSNFGSMLSRLAIPWLATLALDATPAQMGLLVVADVAAGAVGTIALGTLVDRGDKRAVMLTADLLRATVLATLAGLAVLRRLTLPLLVVAAAVGALLTITFELARSTWIAQCVPQPDLPRRNSQLSVAGSLSETAAFALGGWVYQWLGAVLALAVDAASFLVSAGFLRGIREAPAPTGRSGARAGTAAGRWLDDVGVGLATLARSPRLRALAAVEALVALGASLLGTSYMIYVTRELALPTGILGMVFASGGLGSIAGAWWAARAERSLTGGRAIAMGLGLSAIGTACIPLAGGAAVLAIALLVTHQIIGDGGHTLYVVHDRVVRQTSTEPALLARVDAGIRTVGYAASLAGALGGGWLATVTGTRIALWAAAGLLAAAAGLASVALASRETRVLQ